MKLAGNNSGKYLDNNFRSNFILYIFESIIILYSRCNHINSLRNISRDCTSVVCGRCQPHQNILTFHKSHRDTCSYEMKPKLR